MKSAYSKLFFAICILLGFPQMAFPISFVMMDDVDLFDQAEGIVIADVVHSLPSFDGDMETRYVLHIHEVITGPAITSTALLALPGTSTAPHKNLIVPGVPQLNNGGRILLFYSRGNDGALHPQQLLLGLFGEQKTVLGPVYVRALEYSTEYRKKQRSVSLHSPRLAAPFEQWLRDRAMGLERGQNYLVPGLKQPLNTKYAFSLFNMGGQTVPARWFVFDQGKTLGWTDQPGGQTGSTHSISALQNAIAAWADDPDSHILQAYQGNQNYTPNGSSYRVAPCAGNIDNDSNCHHGHVTWNDTENLISGSYNCSSGGTLAFGGSYAYSPARSFDGSSWFPRASAFVVVQDGAACLIDRNNGKDGAELLAHEIGHSLGLDHSCNTDDTPPCNSNSLLNESLMRPFIHADGRGAQLGVDDKAAIAIAYPSTGSPNTGPNTTPATPANNSTTSLGDGLAGSSVTGTISFNTSGGSGSGTTALSCVKTSGTINLTSNATQTVTVGNSAQPVGVAFTLTGSAQSGQVKCTATPQGGTASTYTYNFTANAGSQGPNIVPSSPANNSTTSLGGGLIGSAVSSTISFNTSGGSGSGTTALSCVKNSGTITLTSNATQTIAVGSSAQPVGVAFTLTGSAQSGQVKCTATPQGGTASTYTYNFTANAGVIPPEVIFFDGFE